MPLTECNYHMIAPPMARIKVRGIEGRIIRDLTERHSGIIFEYEIAFSKKRRRAVMALVKSGKLTAPTIEVLMDVTNRGTSTTETWNRITYQKEKATFLPIGNRRRRPLIRIKFTTKQTAISIELNSSPMQKALENALIRNWKIDVAGLQKANL